jgi:hypothetical protein
MSMFPDSQARTRPIELDYGTDNRAVFNFFNAVYAWMFVGLAVTAAVGFFVSQSPTMRQTLYGNGKFGIIALLLGAWVVAWGAQKAALQISATAGTALFLLYAAIIGAMLSGIFIVYPASTLLAAFVLTAGTFGAMSLYGYVTKRDLTTIGSYLVMGAIGLFLASIVNVFIASDGLSWLITYAVLAVFIGLTAYETQKLRNLALEYGHDPQLASRLAVCGSIVLYISFINIFVSILRIIGGRR